MGKKSTISIASCLILAPFLVCMAGAAALPTADSPGDILSGAGRRGTAVIPHGALAAAAAPQENPSYVPYSPEQLDNLLAPIALYPDPLLAQVLLAATFADQIDEAARWVRAYGTNGIDDQAWDVSVKAVAHYPTVLDMMADKLDWTTALGQAYVNQSTDVMEAVQRLRGMAHAQGNLISTPEQEVVVENGYYSIYPFQPQFVYVPWYDPSVIYFRPAYFNGVWLDGFWAFGPGYPIGVWLIYDWDWPGRRIFYHGWHGRHWIERCRPYVHITNVYVNVRYTSVIVNRTIINRRVNFYNIDRYHSVHRDVNYNDHERAGRERVPAVANAPPRVNNTIINRNIDTRDPRLEKYRGRADAGPGPGPAPPAPSPAPQPRPQPPPPAARPMPQPPPHVFGRREGEFDPRASSQRGQGSRVEMNRPRTVPRPAPTPRPTPSAPRPAPPRPPRGRP